MFYTYKAVFRNIKSSPENLNSVKKFNLSKNNNNNNKIKK